MAEFSPRLRNIFLVLGVPLMVAFYSSAAQASDQEQLERSRINVSEGHYHKAYKRMHRLARHGHPTAQYLVGMMYHNGVGVKRSPENAVLWYEKSAQKGFADAQNRLGHMYLNGGEIEKDAVKAEHWLGKAAEQGVVEAQAHLGKAYLHGENGLPRNIEQGTRWLQIAAHNGSDDADKLLKEVPGYSKTSHSIEQGAEEAAAKAKVALERSAEKSAGGYMQQNPGVVQGWQGYSSMVYVMNLLGQASNK